MENEDLNTGGVDTSDATQTATPSVEPDALPNGGINTSYDANDDNSGAAPVMDPRPPVEDDATGVDQRVQQQQQGGGVSPSYGPLAPIADKIKRMLAGEGAVSPQVLDKIIDEQVGATRADKLVNGIHDAYTTKGPDAASAVSQGARAVYGPLSAFARTALLGQDGKPPDLNAAINHANRAQDYLPDGSNIHFAPGQDGSISAHVQMPGTKNYQDYRLTPDQFARFLDVGKEGQWDKLMDVSAPAMLQRIIGSGGQAEPTQNTGGTAEAGEPGSIQNMKPTGGDQPQRMPGANGHIGNARPVSAVSDVEGFNQEGNKVGAKDATAADESSSQPRPRSMQPGLSYNERIKALQDEDADKKAGVRDDMTDEEKGDQRKKAARRAEIEADARKFFPWISQGRQRNKYIMDQLNQDQQQSNAVEVAGEKGKHAEKVAEIAGGSRVKAAQIGADAKIKGWQFASDQKFQLGMAKLEMAERAEKDKNRRAALADFRALMNTKRQTGTPITDQEKAILEMYGAEASKAMDGSQQAQPQAQKPQSNNAPQRSPVRVSSREEAMKLAPGTPYLTPDGRKFTR